MTVSLIRPDEYGRLHEQLCRSEVRADRHERHHLELHEALRPFVEQTPLYPAGVPDGHIQVTVTRKQWYEAQLALSMSQITSEREAS